MMRRICLAIGLAALCFNVLAKPAPLPMPLAPELPVEVVLNQHELAVEVPNTAGAVGMQFGLIGALVGSAIQNAQVKKAEERVIALRNALLDYHFNERVEAELRAKLASEGLSPNPVIMATPWDATDAQQNKQDMPLHAMVIVPHYAIDSGFAAMTVSLNTSIVDRTIKPNGKVKTKILFTRNYTMHLPLAGPISEEENPQRWSGMGAARLGAVLDQAVVQVTDMLVHDFSAAGRAEWAQKIKRETATIKGISYPGRDVRHGDDWVWVRSGNGNYSTLQGYLPVDPTATAMTANATTSATANASASASTAVAAPAASATPAATPAPATQETGGGGQ